jgi:N-formylmaleamate deformylase
VISESSEVMSDWRECDVDADGLTIHVYRAGRLDRPPLVLAHGLSDNGRCWWRVAQAFENDFDVVMIDARNHGQSGTAGGDGVPPTADVAAVVAQLGLDRPTLIGHSVGARTVADFAAVHSGAANRLVLIDPPWTASQESDGEVSDSRREAVRNWLVSCSEATTIELEARAREQHATWPPEEYPTWIESKQQVRPEAADTLVRSGWGETVVAIDCPTLLVHGDAGSGGMVTVDVARRAAALNSGITAVRIAGAGHNIHREQFDRFIEATRNFLGRPIS